VVLEGIVCESGLIRAQMAQDTAQCEDFVKTVMNVWVRSGRKFIESLNADFPMKILYHGILADLTRY